GWSAARLFQDSTTVIANIKFLSQGSVSGVTVDGNGLPTAAIVRLNGLTVDGSGAPKVAELQRVTTDPVTGQFSFSGIPRFDLSTALEPISGLQGQAFAIVPAGGNVDVRIRLLGLGAVSLTVKRADGRVVPNAIVSLERSGFAGSHADAVTGANGVVRFVNLTE